ncbi:MAG: tRNA cyclic N6-threonylcarbamoyladenosine(37) synthase TcdA [Enterobacterales bacterium]|nr:tRNA cyclic N6-threonylcarbamoyladenosine(37) synthase TcdA [Enterobacterales bacterium]
MRPIFSGTQRVYTSAGVNKLDQARVTVIGIGGVGSWVAEALARSAVGSIRLIDLDDICLTNTNRQIHAMQDTIGQLKVEVMAQRIRSINPRCKVIPVIDFVSLNNLEDMIIDTDYVVDAIDNARVKAAIVAYCKRRKIRVITIGGAGGQIDPLKITVSDLSRSWQDPLSAKVRNELRRNYGFSKNPKRRFGVECVYSTEQLLYPNSEGQVSYQKPDDNQISRLDCSQGLGAAVSVTATFGMIAAARVINRIVNIEVN